MAGRGRGGRGRGRGMTFDPRDLGFGVGEQLPGPVLQPPPTFPILENRPSGLQAGPEMDFMIALKKDLSVFLKDYMSLTEAKDWDSNFDWRRLPAELSTRRRAKKRPASTVNNPSKKVTFDIKKLDALVKQEEGSEEQEGDKEETEDKEGEQEGNEDDEMEEDIDEEMDDGTDYVNNYFDNGEDYFDDDDNGNDGPIY